MEPCPTAGGCQQKDFVCNEHDIARRWYG